MVSPERPDLVALSEAERARIRLEETYRSEVRTQLTPRQSQKPLVGFLNSSLGLWSLSAIFLTLLPFGLSRLQGHRDEARAARERKLDDERENRQVVEKLDFEISYRFSAALIDLKVQSQGSAYKLGNRLAGVLPKLDARAGLYPEFEQYSLPALIVELRRRIPEGEGAQQTQIDNSLAKLVALTKGDSVSQRRRAPAPDEVAKELLTSVILDRWKKTRFYYVDCQGQAPFC